MLKKEAKAPQKEESKNEALDLALENAKAIKELKDQLEKFVTSIVAKINSLIERNRLR